MYLNAGVSTVENLPDTIRTKHHVILRGYAANLIWRDKSQDEWFFFQYIEPAWAFIRAARMSEPIEFGIYQAANEVRFYNGIGDVRTIYIADSVNDLVNDEDIELLKRWVDRISPTSKFWPGKHG